MDISIITPTYITNQSRLKWLKQMIQSVEMQKDILIEHIIIDDGSPINIPKEWLNNGIIKYFRIPHSGKAFASNFGTEKATGKYRVSMSDDDFYLHDNDLKTRLLLYQL